MRTLALTVLSPLAVVALAATAHAAPATSIPGDGTFVVGADIAPGTYRTEGPTASGGNCYWERDKNLDGTVSSIIANDNTSGPTTVRISSTDVAFKSDGCARWSLIAMPAPPAPTPAPALPAPPATGSFGL